MDCMYSYVVYKLNCHLYPVNKIQKTTFKQVFNNSVIVQHTLSFQQAFVSLYHVGLPIPTSYAIYVGTIL